MLLTQTERLMMSNRPKDPKNARNKNILVIGGSGSGKTRFFCKPNIMQLHSSYVITDPKGSLICEVGQLLQRAKYRIAVLNTINFSKSMHYNPFAYLRTEKDILKLVNTIIVNTKGEGAQSTEDFWVKAERLYYTALIGYIHYEAPEEEKNFITLLDMINASDTREDDEDYKNPVDLLFDRLEEREPEHFAVKQYRKYKLAAGKTAKSILVSTAVRLAPFNLPQIQALTDHDDMNLYTLGEKKVALYAVIPDNDNTFNFLVSLLYAQAFQALYYSADQIHHGPLPRHVRFVLDEFAAMPLPGFTRELATMRSRSISASVIIQNMAQIKELYKDSWETIPGNCDTILYLGGNESSTHKYVSEMLGKATIDTKTHGQTKGKSGSYSTNFQMSGRELLTPDEVRKLDNRYALLFIRGASPVMDEKYDLMHHPAISHSSLGGAAPYIHHGTKPPIYTGRPLLRVGGTENSNPLKGEFH